MHTHNDSKFGFYPKPNINQQLAMDPVKSQNRTTPSFCGSTLVWTIRSPSRDHGQQRGRIWGSQCGHSRLVEVLEVQRDSNTSSVVKKRHPLVVVPGFGADYRKYQALQDELVRVTGQNVYLVPTTSATWLKTFGGRPVTPVLELISSVVETSLRESQEEKITLVGHSAGGWISRIWLGSKHPYRGTIYAGASKVDSLITLGTPHTSFEPVTQENMNFVNTKYPGAFEPDVRYVCIGGTGLSMSETEAQAVKGRFWNPRWFAKVSYQLTAGEGNLLGDGVVPCSVTSLSGAHNVLLRGIFHAPDSPGPWYGHPAAVRYWTQFCR
uniref:DUF676 domain-containing protein n=1 Tax=Compsopogon caeruleus TaxID=31354 RepID=A0A7S1TEH2_9RHOD|mmetsp:Transcript_2417/g.4180  ORF Transcript_2417/g.4180 Transcript_2417/m.4180 type:complete len:324 (+) Transcript_2417:93-1064(+)